jgi:SAM-dependent methyltransferase
VTGDSAGPRFLKQFVLLCGLGPDERVLEIGCGRGRIASALAEYLGERGSYDGLDVARDDVDHCISSLPHLRFRHADVRNGRYNPQGTLDAAEFSFPYGDSSFDFAVLVSVFTHMLPEGAERYLSEIARVLRPGGRMFATLFLVNDESRGHDVFRHPVGPHLAADPDVPERAIALDEAFVRGACARASLQIREPVFGGSWCGRENCLSDQDILIASVRPRSL